MMRSGSVETGTKRSVMPLALPRALPRSLPGALLVAGLLPLLLAGCSGTMKTLAVSGESVSICFHPKEHQQADTLPAATQACARVGKRPRYAASAACGSWTKVIYRCVK